MSIVDVLGLNTASEVAPRVRNLSIVQTFEP